MYLGLNPPPNVIHYPVIRTERIENTQALSLWPEITHVIFTSQEAVRYWGQSLLNKQVIAVGEATGSAVRKWGGEPLIASPSTQEGVIALLQTLDLSKAYILFPHSRKAREGLIQFLKSFRHYSFPLYDTLFQQPKPVPDLTTIDEIVFTSPSTVEGFLRIFGTLPLDKKLTAIGPITEFALRSSAH